MTEAVQLVIIGHSTLLESCGRGAILPLLAHAHAVASDKVLVVLRDFLPISGPVFRCVTLVLGADDLGILTPASFDALGLGALLALGGTMCRAQPTIRLLGLASFLLLIVISLTFLFFDSALLTEYVQRVLIPLLWALALAALVLKTAEGFTGPVGSVFTFPPLRYIGRISYGVYLYHMPICVLVWAATERLGITSGPIRFAFVGSISLIIAALSALFRRADQPAKAVVPLSSAGPDGGHFWNNFRRLSDELM